MVDIAKVPSGKPSQAAPEDLEARGIVPRQSEQGRPYIWKPDGSKRIYYSRPSGLGGTLDSKDALLAWKERMILEGVRLAPGLMREYEEIVTDPSFDPGDKACKAKVQNIATRAQEIAGTMARADIGTALHEITEDIDLGRDPGWIPPDLEPLVYAYSKAMQDARRKFGIEVIATEVFMVNDEWKVAGTLDKLLTYRDKIVIGDSKSSRTMAYSRGKYCMQLAAYAGGNRYSPQAALHGVDEGMGVGRSPYVGGMEVDREEAIIIHFPSDGARCELLTVPIGHAAWGYDTLLRLNEWRNFWNRKANRFEEEPLHVVHGSREEIE